MSPGAVVLAAAIPILFLHVSYQPGVGVGFGSTTVNAYLSDFAVLAVVVVALVEGVRDGFAPLAPGRPLWVAAGALPRLDVRRGRARPPCTTRSYPLAHARRHRREVRGVRAARTVRCRCSSRRSRDVLLPRLVARRSGALSRPVVGIAQFFGANIFLAGTVGHRQASFLAVGGLRRALGSGAPRRDRRRSPCRASALGRALVATALVTGVLGMIVAGALASVLGLATALVALAVVLAAATRARRCAASPAVAAAALVVLGGAIAIRGTDLDAFAHFLGAKHADAQAQQAKVQTYAHRTLLAWIGWQIWNDHPLARRRLGGLGRAGELRAATCPAAHRHFPNESPLAFPSPRRTGATACRTRGCRRSPTSASIGLVLWVAVFASAAWLARARRRAAAGALRADAWTALLAWLWTAQGYVAGIPLDALTWLTFGLAATRLRAE